MLQVQLPSACGCWHASLPKNAVEQTLPHALCSPKEQVNSRCSRAHLHGFCVFVVKVLALPPLVKVLSPGLAPSQQALEALEHC